MTGVRLERDGDFLRLDASTRRNLELTETLRGEPAPTLLSLLDTCATCMGSRWLRHALHHPLRVRDSSTLRHDAVTALIGDRGDGPCNAVRERLRGIADIERITARIALNSARPRDLSSLRDSLIALAAPCATMLGQPAAPLLAGIATTCMPPAELRSSCWFARFAANPPRWCATAASSPTASTPISTNCAACRTTAAPFCSNWKPANASAPASPT